MNQIKYWVILPLVLVLVGCSSGYMKASSALRSGEIRLSDYKYVTIKKYKRELFMELELESLLEAQGLKVIGQKAAKNKIKLSHRNKVLKVRYEENEVRGGYGENAGSALTVLLEDFRTDKALLSVTGSQTYGHRRMAWDEISAKLNDAFAGRF